VDAIYPVLIADFAPPRLRTYPVYTVIAEKLHAIEILGMTNSRLKDYFDLKVLLVRETLDAETLAKAIAATFTRRGTALTNELLIGLSQEFETDKSRQTLWAAFTRKNALAEDSLASVVTELRTKLAPVLIQAAAVQGALARCVSTTPARP
jgi:hypothetical protein